MKEKTKKLSILIGSMLLLSALFVLPSVSAADVRTVYGYIYVNGAIADSSQVEKVVLNFSTQEIEADLFENNTYYIVDFSEDKGEMGTFEVTITTGTWLADENITMESGVYNYSLDLHINTSNPPVNNAPNKPTLESPLDGVTVGSETKATLKVRVTDDDGDSMDVSFYDASDDSQIGSTQTGITSGNTASVTWSGLNSGTTHSWYAIANDGIAQTKSDTWSFKTKASSPPSPPPPSPPPPAETNEPPTAVITGPDIGNAEEELEFDALASSDSDGTIESYEWDLDNDGEYDDATGDTVTHSWSLPPNELSVDYTISLRVTDDDGATDTDSKTVTIVKQNNPPGVPNIVGPTEGEINIEYNFTISATDEDNDTIQYTIDWGDGNTTTTEFLPNGTSTTQSHSWSKGRTFDITVTAFDNNTETATTYTITITEPEPQPTGKEKEENNILWYILAIILILIILALFLLVAKKREKKK